MDIGTLTGSITLDDQMSKVLIKVDDLLNQFGETSTAQAAKFQSSMDGSIMKGTFFGNVLADLAIKGFNWAKDLISDSLMAGARLEQLTVATGFLGEKSGYTKQYIDDLAKQIQKTGISGIETRESILQLLGANIDLANASKLSAIAQNMQGLSGRSSSDVFQTLARAIATGNTELLRGVGITDISIDGLQRQKKALTGVGGALTGAERSAAILNAILEKGAQFTGLYAANMETAGKQASSASRAWDEVSEQIGTVLLPITTVAIESWYKLGGAVRDAVMDAQGKVKPAFVAIANGLETVIQTLAQLAVDAIPILIKFVGYVIDITKTLYEWRDVLVPLAAGFLTYQIGLAAIATYTYAADAAATIYIVSLYAQDFAIKAVNLSLMTVKGTLATLSAAIAVFAAGYELGTWLEKNTKWARELSDAFEYAALRAQGYSAAEADRMIATQHVTEAAQKQAQIEKERIKITEQSTESSDAGARAAREQAARTLALQQAQAKAAEEAKKLKNELDKLTGVDIVAGAQELANHIEAIGGPLAVLPSKAKALATQFEAAAAAANHIGNAKLAETFDKLATTFRNLEPLQSKTLDFYVELKAAVEEVRPPTELLADSIANTGKAGAAAQKELMDWANSTGAVFQPVVKASSTASDAVQTTWKSNANKMASDFADMFSGINSQWGQMAKVAGSAFKTITAEGDQAATKMQKFAAVAAAASEVIGSMFGDTKAGGIASGALGGAAAGAAFGGIGAAIGGVVGAIGGWISSTKKAKEENDKANKSLDDLRNGLIKTYGSLENLEAVSQRLFGESMVAEWGHQGVKGLQQFQQIADKFEERMKAVGEATNKMVSGFGAVTAEMTAPWTQLGDQIGAAHEKTMAAKLAMEEYTGGSVTKIEELKNKYLEASATEEALNTKRQEYATQSAQTLEALGVQAIATFAGVYQATGSWSEALHSISPQLVQLQDSYKALGLETDNVYLKNLMLQANVAEASPQLITAIDGQAAAMQGMAQMGLLNVDTFNAMQQTAMELYIRLQGETANAAAEAGDLGDQSRNALLPMQGYLQQAATQAELLGIPLNDNTQMLIDQSKALGIWQEAGVTAQDKLIDGMQSIVDKLDVLLGKLGSMTYSLANMPDAESTVTVNHVDTYRSIFYEDERAGGGDAQNRAGGGVIVQNNNYYAGGTEFVPHGSDTVPAMLTPGERVLTTQENKAYTQDKEQSQNTEKLERTLDGIRQDLRRNNDTLLISLQSMLEHAV